MYPLMRAILVLWILAGVMIAGDKPDAGSDSSPAWKQWRGPNFDGISSEDISSSWLGNGPAELWRREFGAGFSGMSIADGRLYTMTASGPNEYAVCLDVNSGKDIWRVVTGNYYREGMGGDGPRSTPAIDENRVYMVSAYGTLYALDCESGAQIWSVDLTKAYGAKMPRWGFSGSTLIYGDLLMLDVGGNRDYSVMAFDKHDGSVVWHSLTDNPGYASPVPMKTGDVQQVLFFTGTRIASVSPENGALYWQHSWKTSYNVNAATPVLLPGNRVFISSGYDYGAAMLQVSADGPVLAVKEIWRNRVMKNHMTTSIFYNDHLYGFSDGTLMCIDAATGESTWRKRGFGKGTLLMSGEYFIILGDNGRLVLIEATPEDFRQVADAGNVLKGRSWTVPTLLAGKLYLRNLNEIVCYDFGQ